MPPKNHAPKPVRALAAGVASAGLFSNTLTAALVALPALMIATPAHAQSTCSNNSGVTQNMTFTYSAATIANVAILSFPSQMVCISPQDGTALCIGAKYTRTAASGSNTITFRVGYNDSTNSISTTNMDNTGAMNGPEGPAGKSISSTNVTVTTRIPAGGAQGVPAGTYTNAFEIYMDMTNSTCSSYGTDQTEYAYGEYTANYVIPKLCTLVTPPSIDFGTVSSIGPTAARLDAQGSVVVSCNSAYTVYIGDGKNRVSAGSGNRQMANGTLRLPYQLYRDSNRTLVWDETGGTAATGGSGGVSGTGVGANQTLTVYAAIPASTALPAAGAYTDTVIVTVTY